MKRLAFPIVLATIIAAGIAFSSASNAARRGVSEEDLLRSGLTVDHSCGTVTTGNATGAGESLQLAAAIKCEAYSDGSCITEGAGCGPEGKKGLRGRCTTVAATKRKPQDCACVK